MSRAAKCLKTNHWSTAAKSQIGFHTLLFSSNESISLVNLMLALISVDCCGIFIKNSLLVNYHLIYFCFKKTGIDKKEILNKVQCSYHLPCPENGVVECPTEVYEIMLSCWNRKPEARPRFSKLQRNFQDFLHHLECTFTL